jgi:hypothetical protein
MSTENVSNEEKGNVVLADVTPSNLTLKVTNCRGIAKLQDIANGIGKDRVINIQKMYPDDDIYFLYYWG